MGRIKNNSNGAQEQNYEAARKMVSRFKQKKIIECVKGDDFSTYSMSCLMDKLVSVIQASITMAKKNPSGVQKNVKAANEYLKLAKEFYERHVDSLHSDFKPKLDEFDRKLADNKGESFESVCFSNFGLLDSALDSVIKPGHVTGHTKDKHNKAQSYEAARKMVDRFKQKKIIEYIKGNDTSTYSAVELMSKLINVVQASITMAKKKPSGFDKNVKAANEYLKLAKEFYDRNADFFGERFKIKLYEFDKKFENPALIMESSEDEEESFESASLGDFRLLDSYLASMQTFMEEMDSPELISGVFLSLATQIYDKASHLCNNLDLSSEEKGDVLDFLESYKNKLSSFQPHDTDGPVNETSCTLSEVHVADQPASNISPSDNIEASTHVVPDNDLLSPLAPRNGQFETVHDMLHQSPSCVPVTQDEVFNGYLASMQDFVDKIDHHNFLLENPQAIDTARQMYDNALEICNKMSVSFQEKQMVYSYLARYNGKLSELEFARMKYATVPDNTQVAMQNLPMAEESDTTHDLLVPVKSSLSGIVDEHPVFE